MAKFDCVSVCFVFFVSICAPFYFSICHFQVRANKKNCSDSTSISLFFREWKKRISSRCSPSFVSTTETFTDFLVACGNFRHFDFSKFYGNIRNASGSNLTIVRNLTTSVNLVNLSKSLKCFGLPS